MSTKAFLYSTFCAKIDYEGVLAMFFKDTGAALQQQQQHVLPRFAHLLENRSINTYTTAVRIALTTENQGLLSPLQQL